MKRLLFSCALILITAAAGAQRRSTVNGVVADRESKAALPGVVVELVSAGDSTRVTTVVSGAGGAFSSGVPREDIRIRARMIGYQPVTDLRVAITEARQKLDTIWMSQGVQIDAVVKQAVAMRTSAKGDTLIYNADAFKVAADANVSGLLEKMPGIKVENGAVQAQGESVKKVLIDGREFFGEDVNAAITALPAEAVKNIEVFDKLSDNAEFTGIDDGEGYKAINIVTRESMKQGVMGQVQALYGYAPAAKDHYALASGNVNIFNGDAKITVGGTVNNLNERHFTSEDILGAGDADGVAKVGRGQINYIDTWGKRNQWTFDASYSYGITDAENLNVIDREYYAGEDAVYKTMHSESLSDRVNQNHRLSARIDWKPNKYQELRIRPSFSYQGRRSDATSTATYFPVDESGAESLYNWSTGRETGWRAGLNANYRVRLGKPGRTVSLFFNGMYDPDDERSESYSERLGGEAPNHRSSPAKDFTYSAMAGLTYTEPLNNSSLVNLDYHIRHNYESIDNKTYEWLTAMGAYDTTPNNNLSGEYNSAYTTHRVGPGYRYMKGKNTFSAGVSWTHAILNSTRVLPDAYTMPTKSFNNITYAAMLDRQFESGASIRLRMFSRTQNPSVSNLQDVVKSSGQTFSTGNPNLEPTYNHMGFFRLNIPSVSKGRTFSFNVGGQYTMNSIANRTITNSAGYPITTGSGEPLLDANGQKITMSGVERFSMPINMDGAWSGRMGLDYGFPATWIRSNINLSAELSLSGSPSEIGKWNGGAIDNVTWSKNFSRTVSSGGGITLGSNISEKVDFRISYNLTYNDVRNSSFAQSNREYLRHQVRGEAKFVLPLGFTLAGNGTAYSYSVLKGNDRNERYLILNGAVGKKIFRDQSGEISLFVNDLLNQNTDFERTSTAEYFQSSTSSAIGRYVGIKFTWNIRKFGKNGSRNMDLYKTNDSEHRHNHWGRPAGGPPPMGGPRPF